MATRCDEPRVLQRPGRHVRGQPSEQRTGVQQSGTFGGDLLEHPRVDLDDEAGLLGDVDEVGRQHQPVAVLDARQRLGDRTCPVARSMIGWNTGTSRLSASARRSSRSGGHPAVGPRAQLVVEQRVLVAAGVLGPVEREVRLAVEVAGAAGRVVGDRDAQAHRRHQRLGGRTEVVGPAQRLQQPGRHGVHRLGRRQPLDQDDELVAAEPRHRRVRAAHGLDPVRDLHEQRVADLVAERVVDRLEPVDVEQQHRRDAAGAVQPGQCLVEPVVEQRPVRQPGQGVGEREPLELGLLAQPLADVHRVGDEVERLPVRTVHHGAGDPGVHDAAVPVQVALLERHRLVLAVRQPGELAGVPLAVLRVGQLAERHPDQLVAGAADHRLERGVRAQVPAVVLGAEADHRHADRRVLEGDPEVLLAGAAAARPTPPAR